MNARGRLGVTLPTLPTLPTLRTLPTPPILRIAPILGAAAVIAGCGSSASKAGPPTTGATSNQPAATQAKVQVKHAQKAARPVGPAIGATQTLRSQGTKLGVTVLKVVDPLKGSGATLLPATRVVGVFVRIANRGSAGYDSSSTGDISIIPSSGVASPAYAPQGQCMTPDRDFDNAIGPGESREGCVVFTLDAAAKLIGERFSAGGGGGAVATWRGPKQG